MSDPAFSLPADLDLAGIQGIAAALEHFAAGGPHRAAYVDYQGVLSYGQLLTAMRRGAAWLARQGVAPGDIVALPLDAGPSHARRGAELLCAIAWLGARALPLFPEVPLQARLAMIRRFGARWVLAGGDEVDVGDAKVLDIGRFTPHESRLDAHVPPRADLPGAPFLYRFTSGTVGAPKVFLNTHAELFCGMRAAALALGLGPDDRQMPAVPWPSSVGMRQLFRSLSTGGCFVAARPGETRAELAAVLTHFAVTSMSASPWQLRRWLKSPAVPLPSLRSLQLLGDLVAPEELRAARAELSARTYVGFGCNEVGTLTLLPPGEEAPEGGVGRLLPGIEARVDDGAGGSLPAGETGDLAFRAPWMCKAYEDNPQATQARFRDGWFFSGDVGCIGADGQVQLRGRSTDVINHGGLKIWPGDIETVLRRHPQLRDAALVGMPDPMAGQVPVAFVVPRDAALLQSLDRADATPGVWLGTQWGAHWGDDWGNQSGVPLSARATPGAALIESLRAFCLEHIDATRVPRRFMLVAEIPRNEAGKIVREALVAGLARRD